MPADLLIIPRKPTGKVKLVYDTNHNYLGRIVPSSGYVWFIQPIKPIDRVTRFDTIDQALDSIK